jgi:glycosyltransferase involved in cell wall biosynthesis
MLDLSVVVPVRNAEALIEECLDSIVRSGVTDIVVVDGMSIDGTLEILQRYPVRVLSDEGHGLPAARLLGAQAATHRNVALVDADVVLPEGALAALLREFQEGGYTALQAGLHSVGGSGYWSQALAYHHRTGRSKNWFGLVATIFERDVLIAHGFDQRFQSGEDIELRWRLQQQGLRAGVSEQTVVLHRFEEGWHFAKGQWLADGRGLGRMVRKHRWRGVRLALLPAAACARGVLLSLVRLQPRWVPYFLCYTAYNYVGMSRAM